MLKTLLLASVMFSGISAKAQSQCTEASHYGVGDGFHGGVTASGERFNAYALTAAHKSFPFGTRVKVTNQSTGKSIVVKINDDGPHVRGRTLDLSYGAFSKIAHPSQGTANVCYAKI